MEAIEILKKKLVGNFYSRFSVGDTWKLCFDDFWLIGHNVVSVDEGRLNDYLQSNYLPAQSAIDQENVSKSIIISSTQRKLVTEVTLNANSALTLTFENSVQLTFATGTGIVDWQWALNENGGDPYASHIVSCFNSGEVQVGSC